MTRNRRMDGLINRQQIERETDWIKWSEGIPDEAMPEARKVWESLTATALMDFSHALQRLVYPLMGWMRR